MAGILMSDQSCSALVPVAGSLMLSGSWLLRGDTVAESLMLSGSWALRGDTVAGSLMLSGSWTLRGDTVAGSLMLSGSWPLRGDTVVGSLMLSGSWALRGDTVAGSLMLSGSWAVRGDTSGIPHAQWKLSVKGRHCSEFKSHFNYTYYTVTHKCLRSMAYSYSCLVQKKRHTLGSQFLFSGEFSPGLSQPRKEEVTAHVRA